MVHRAVERFNLGALHQEPRAVRGRPPFHPKAMAGRCSTACRGVYASCRLQWACRHDVSFLYLMGGVKPDFHAICELRKRFEAELKDLFNQVLQMCHEAGPVRLGHVSLDGTKVRANASKHKAMSHERLQARRKAYEEEIEGWFTRAEHEDAEDDEEHGAAMTTRSVSQTTELMGQVQLGRFTSRLQVIAGLAAVPGYLQVTSCLPLV